MFLLCNLQAFIATHSGAVTKSYSLQLDKGKRSRLEEDAVASKLLLQAFGKACKLPDSSSLDLGLLSGSEQVQVQLSGQFLAPEAALIASFLHRRFSSTTCEVQAAMLPSM